LFSTFWPNNHLGNCVISDLEIISLRRFVTSMSIVQKLNTRVKFRNSIHVY
jgi:hypothetical protein